MWIDVLEKKGRKEDGKMMEKKGRNKEREGRETERWEQVKRPCSKRRSAREGKLFKVVLWPPHTCAPAYTVWNTQHMCKHTCTHDTHGLSGYMLTTAALFRCYMLSKHVHVVTPKHFSSTSMLHAKDSEKDVICPELHSQHQKETAQLSAQILTTIDRLTSYVG